jgi:hypothetical protein
MFVNPNTFVDVELPLGSVLYVYSGVNSKVVVSSVVQEYSVTRLDTPVTVDGVSSFGPFAVNLTIRVEAGDALAEYAVNDSSLIKTVPSKLIGIAQPANIVVPADTFDTLTVADDDGFVQLVSEGEHGLTTEVSVGNFVYVTWSEGAGVDGFYEIDSLDADTTGTEITIKLDYEDDLGTPTVAVAGDTVLLSTITVPANSVLDGASLSINAFMSCLDNEDSKTVEIDLGDETILNIDIADSASASVDKKVFNIGGGNVITSAEDSLGMSDVSANASVPLEISMSEDQDIKVYVTPDTANNPVTLESLIVKAVY